MKRALAELSQFALPVEAQSNLKVGGQGGGQYVFVDDGNVTHVYWKSNSGTLTYIRTLNGLIA